MFNKNTRKIIITNELGLHARPAAMLVKTASIFECDIKIKKQSEEVNAKSIMNLMILGAGKGTELAFFANGPDANEALDAIEKLFKDNFGE
ncbi:MAG: HPr family phosphocarrier protein [Verrucomicrobiota bacterium]|nr:HPr family phosphocarrier protein [Verrucomicrobiota bacterium]